MNDDMNATGLLTAAARLVDKALGKLDASGRPCSECGHMHFDKPEEARVFEQLANIPERLRNAASRLSTVDAQHAVR